MSEFKYNVGDKVISLYDLSLWDNSIHFEKFKASFIKTVTSANAEYFSVTAYDVNQPMNYDSLNDRHIFKQKMAVAVITPIQLITICIILFMIMIASWHL